MTDPIRIPAYQCFDREGRADGRCVDITPDLARQIVAMAQQPAQPVAAFAPSPEWCAHAAELERGFTVSAGADALMHQAADGGAGEAESDDTCEIERLRDSLHIMANQSARYMKERDDLAKRLEAVTRELAAYKTGQAINDDAMRTLAAELGDGKECISTNTDAINAARIIKQERDKALADLAAERAAHGLEKQAHEHTWNHKAELIADLAAANERAERAEKLADSLAGNGGR
jgi:hypothetical protein